MRSVFKDISIWLIFEWGERDWAVDFLITPWGTVLLGWAVWAITHPKFWLGGPQCNWPIHLIYLARKNIINIDGIDKVLWY